MGRGRGALGAGAACVIIVLAGCASGEDPRRNDVRRDAAPPASGIDAATGDGSVDADGGPEVGVCGACEEDAECGPGHYCAKLTIGGKACLPSCNPDIPTCPRGFNCVHDIASGVAEPLCEPVGGPCCIDQDADGYGEGVGCDGLDCDDMAAARNPDATERCDGIDDDCDGLVDEGPEEICDNGEDDDCDGYADCGDSECDGLACGTDGVLCSDMMCVCPGGTTESACGNGEDDDCDGMVDCEDPDCADLACGDAGLLCLDGACACPGPDQESTCDDGLDGDCDGVADCLDPDCGGLSCDSYGQLCSGLVCSCPGDAELCNGEDDDCDGFEDEGCPTGDLDLCCDAAGPTFGGPGGTPFTRRCPDGTVLVGFDGAAGTRVDRLAPVCADLDLDARAGSPELTFRAAIGAPTALGEVGGVGGGVFADRCDAGEMVIGLVGRSGVEVDRLGFTCGRVQLERAAGGAFRVERTGTGAGPSRGGTGGASFTYECPGNRVAVGIEGRAGDRLDAISLTCAEVTFSTR